MCRAADDPSVPLEGPEWALEQALADDEFHQQMAYAEEAQAAERALLRDEEEADA